MRDTRLTPTLIPVLLLLSCGLPAAAGDFTGPNRVIRDGAIRYGDAQFDPQTNLVRRADRHHNGRLDICQHSLEYAAALLAAGEQIERANAVLSAVVDHQDVDEDSRTFGNFRWWHDEARVHDRNAVCFMSPWLAHIAMEHGEKLTPENSRRLREALSRCIRGVRSHGSGVDYTNIWLLKAASLVMLGRALGEGDLQADGARRIDEWIAYTAENGISEYNSPCYNAVNVYALEWIHHYATDATLRQKVAQCLDYVYADVFQNWHWESGIGAGTHSRAYDRDRDTGRSLVSCLVFKQCGRPLRQEMRSFLYVFAVNDYPVPDRIRAAARKEGVYPFRLRYKILRDAGEVDCSLYMTGRFSLATQTRRRPVYNDRPLWDLPFKITYAGSSTERRASYVAHAPTTKHATIASLQHGPTAIVVYEVDMKGSKLRQGRLRLDIEPRDGGMCDEIIVAGRAYDRSQLTLAPGTVLGWRVAETLVAVRLLESRGLDPSQPEKPQPLDYRIGPVPDAGLCLDCPLIDEPSEPVAVNDLSCGFTVACATTEEHKSLGSFLEEFAEWEVAEEIDDGRRRIDWQADEARLQLVWDGANNQVLSQTVDGQPVATHLRYDSPLIRLAEGDPPAVLPSK
ncbi:MAG: hypothetical protein HQ582_11120 [Planctomycetes bacterium]|nr:hypothetical protein [Planctomycetota bacterium]